MKNRDAAVGLYRRIYVPQMFHHPGDHTGLPELMNSMGKKAGRKKYQDNTRDVEKIFNFYSNRGDKEK